MSGSRRSISNTKPKSALQNAVEIHAKEILFLKQRLNEIMAKHSGQSVDTVSKDTDRDNFLSAEQSVKYGLVDKVLTSRADVQAA